MTQLTAYCSPRHCSKISWTVFFISGLYYKHITTVNDDSIMMLQVVASPIIVFLTTLEVSFMLLANFYSRGVTHDVIYF
jgi:hypothetical protein